MLWGTALAQHTHLQHLADDDHALMPLLPLSPPHSTPTCPSLTRLLQPTETRKERVLRQLGLKQQQSGPDLTHLEDSSSEDDD